MSGPPLRRNGTAPIAHPSPAHGTYALSLAGGLMHSERSPERTLRERTPIMSDTISLTYKELAERLGMSPDSARIKARRLKWPVIPGNHPGDPVHVRVPLSALNRRANPVRSPG